MDKYDFDQYEVIVSDNGDRAVKAKDGSFHMMFRKSDGFTAKKSLQVILILRITMLLHCDNGISSRSSGLKNCVHGRTKRKFLQLPVRFSTVTYS